MFNPILRAADRISSAVVGYPRVTATKECDHCNARQGNRHRLAGCEGNERDVRRRFLVNPGETLTDAEVDRRYAQALEQHRRNVGGEAS